MKRILTFMVALLCACMVAQAHQTVNKSKKNVRKSELRIATFNLRMDTPKDGVNAWPNRKEMVKDLVRFYDFDIFGTQEAFKHMLDDIKTDAYAYIGRGRDDGKEGGEHSAIFYKPSRFDLLEHGDFWYSQTPDRPGLGWDAVCNRICTWGKFRDKKNGKVFFVFNSHFDHQGVVARRESAKLLMKKIKAIATGFPVFATGDYNAVEENEPMQVILKDGLLTDAYHLTKEKPYGTTGTFNNFNVNAEMKMRIDHIFVTKDISIKKYGVLNDMQYGRFPSDHFPVMVVAKF